MLRVRDLAVRVGNHLESAGLGSGQTELARGFPES